MKKTVAILMALAVLFSFALAETTPTNLNNNSSSQQQATVTAAPTAAPTEEPAPAEEEEEAIVINFREEHEAELAQGTYTQVYELPLQYWVVNDQFTAKEIPAEEGYEETFAILSYNANPELELLIDCGETELDFETFYGNLTADDMKDYFSSVSRATVNGLEGASYIATNEDATETQIVEYFIPGDEGSTFVKFYWTVNGDEQFSQYASLTAISLEEIK